jgi:hypothetical protein
MSSAGSLHKKVVDPLKLFPEKARDPLGVFDKPKAPDVAAPAAAPATAPAASATSAPSPVDRSRVLFAGAAGEVARGDNEADTLGRPRRRSASRELLG